MFVLVPGSKDGSNMVESTDTEDMLSALRRQIQPHLVMALQGHKNMNMPSYPHLQVRTFEKCNLYFIICKTNIFQY